MSNLTANWNYPTAIRVGQGRIRELADACHSLHIKVPLLVTDPGLASSNLVTGCLDALNTAGLRAALFSDIKPNPIGENIEAGVQHFQRGQHDGVIGFGGGSALDAAKAVALMVGQDRPIWDFEDVGDNWTRVNVAAMAPIVAVPTTAGTGSEVGRASVITDNQQHVKKIIFHPRMLPAQVILDPQLTVGLPPRLTAATGMDALSHNLEALCSPHFHPMAQGIAVEGIHLVKNYLPRAFTDGTDIEARTQMLVCSSMGATAFQKGLGAMHALSHPLGALYDAHHGTLNAILMPYVLQANETAVAERLTQVARYLGLSNPSFAAFLDWVLALREQLQVPSTLAEIGIDDIKAETIGQMAVADPSAGGNPTPFNAEQYQQIFLNALAGNG